MNILMIIVCILMVGVVIWQTLLQQRIKNICAAFDDLFIKFMQHNQEIYGIQKKQIQSLTTVTATVNDQIKEFHNIKKGFDYLKTIPKELDTTLINFKRTVDELKNQKTNMVEVNRHLKSISDEVNALKKIITTLQLHK